MPQFVKNLRAYASRLKGLLARLPCVCVCVFDCGLRMSVCRKQYVGQRPSAPDWSYGRAKFLHAWSMALNKENERGGGGEGISLKKGVEKRLKTEWEKRWDKMHFWGIWTSLAQASLWEVRRKCTWMAEHRQKTTDVHSFSYATFILLHLAGISNTEVV